MARTRQQSKARSNGQPCGQQYGRRHVHDAGPRRQHGRADRRGGGELPGLAALATGPGEDVLIKRARAAVAPAVDVLAV
ncbi:hypothetical protein ACFC1R_07505 [Kitasatospora sp. NPDC056138]|uniref:hypothetical protein n=1 Tax=Kitasatospora sp. NPDC056138 TaxID=3345724 RepID=UPI0035DC0F78